LGLLSFFFRAIVVLVIFRLAGIVFRAFMWGFGQGLRPSGPSSTAPSSTAPAGETRRGRPQEAGRIEELVKDPVCGVHVARSSAIVGRYEGREAYFCSEACAAKARA